MITLTEEQLKTFTYDDYLDFFRQMPTTLLKQQQEELKNTIPVEGYAALSRWLEIIDNPSKMDKLYQGRLKAQAEADIMDVAVGDDDEAFWMALIRENVQQLNSSTTSPQEVARLTQNLGIFRDKLHEIRARKPKKGTTLERVLEKASISAKSKSLEKKQPSETPSEANRDKKTTKVSSKKEKAV